VDINSPVVGQEVRMKSGAHIQTGRVAEVTEQYVLVEVWRDISPGRFFIRFNSKTGKTGTGWDDLGLFEYIGEEVGLIQSDPRLPDTESGPWELEGF
jgi:hypothetical protein